MAFDYKNMAQVSTHDGTNTNKSWAYKSTTDTIATIIASAYFNSYAGPLSVNDLIYITGSDGLGLYYVTAVSPNVTVAALQPGTNFTILYAEVTVSSAEILALRATPKTLIAAPGAGRVIQLLEAALFLDYNSAGYTETADNMAIRYNNGTGVILSQTIEATGFIDQTADTMTVALPRIDAIAAKTACENLAVVLHNTGDGEYAAGNSPIRVKVAYRVHTTGW